MLAEAAQADEAFREAVKAMLLPGIEATLTGEQRAVDEAAAAIAERVPEVMAAHVPALTALYEQLEPLVPPDMAPHVVALREHMTWLAEHLVAAGASADAMTAVLDDPAGEAASRAVSALARFRRESCGAS